MMSKVLSECFRPILGSFQTRLESVLRPSASKTTGAGSLENICALYEATLQFLTLAYEAVAGSWHDVADATTSASGVKLYQSITGVILQVASPFLVYQQHLGELEGQHSTVAQQLIAKDIRQAVSISNPNTVSMLQDATERLKGLAPFIFPLTEAAVVRLELLTGGYRIRESLSTIDSILSTHAGELAIAIRTLSAAMTSNQADLANSFDDMHVSCALEVLKVAGTFQRCLTQLENTTKDRATLLAQRMVALSAQEKELDEGSSSSFLLPDALSVVEIDSLLTRQALGGDEDAVGSETGEGGTAAASLRRIDLPYPDAREATTRLAQSCHAFVFDVCMAVPRQHLIAMSTMSSWTKEDIPSTSGFTDASYGTLPQSYITLVGEHMLALVQALEPFASDPESLALANEVMNGVRSVALTPWKELVSAIGASDSAVEAMMGGKGLLEFIPKQDEEDEEDDGWKDDDVEEDDTPSATFCNAWLDVFGLAVTGRLLERIVRIPRLTTKGCEHLSADLNYMVNVLAALGVSGHPHPLVHHVAQVVVESDDSGRLAGNNSSLAVALKLLEERIAVIRS